MRLAQAGTGGAIGSEPQRLTCRRRQPEAVSERFEDGRRPGFALTPCPLAQPSLADAGQLRYPSLREPLRAQDHDDPAEIPPGARVEHVLLRKDPLDYLAHLKDA